VILRLSRLGWSQEQIAGIVSVSRNRISEIVGNANFCNIDILLSMGHDMDYIARHYTMDLSLAWALRLEGMIAQTFLPERKRSLIFGRGEGISSGKENFIFVSMDYRTC